MTSGIVKVLTSEAPVVRRNLNGLICLNKPTGKHVRSVCQVITNKICQELNQLNVRPPNPHVKITGDTSKGLIVSVNPSYADNPKVIGPRYIPEEICLHTGNFLGPRTSGVLVVGIDEGTRQAQFLRNARLLRTYLLKGKLGVMTDNCFEDGKVLFQGRYDFITRGSIDKVTATMQALHRKMVFDLCAIDGQSQTAYELASSGQLRPINSSAPVIYSLKCVDFSPPEFTIEVQCINETEDYLIELVSHLGDKLRTAAICVQIKCIRFSFFNLDDALLLKHWTLQNLVNSVRTCEIKYKKIRTSVSPTLASLKDQEKAATN